MVLQIAYDLHQHGRDYDAVYAVIKAAGSNTHPQGSVWLVDTLTSPQLLRDGLHKAGDENDEYFVAPITRNWASFNMNKESVEWLNSSSRRW
ncbi:MAG: hypothetical protein QG553_543 [Patescibacteria group bacterium]|nr:hypothetical protein [Patescibacteria group bacterium]